MTAERPRIAVTIGDPAGIGPEVVLKAVRDEQVLAACVPIIIGDAHELSHQARRLDLTCGLPIFNVGEKVPADLTTPSIYNLANVHGPVEMGVESAVCGKAAGEYIIAGVELCMSGQVDAISTAPLNKKALFLGGYSYPGHTEFLAHLTGIDDYRHGVHRAGFARGAPHDPSPTRRRDPAGRQARDREEDPPHAQRAAALGASRDRELPSPP